MPAPSSVTSLDPRLPGAAWLPRSAQSAATAVRHGGRWRLGVCLACLAVGVSACFRPFNVRDYPTSVALFEAGMAKFQAKKFGDAEEIGRASCRERVSYHV